MDSNRPEEGGQLPFGPMEGAEEGPSDLDSSPSGNALKKGKVKKPASEDITMEMLRELFHLPMKDAASKIGVGATVFKEVCRKRNISKWPYRQLNALNESLEKVEKAAAGKAMDANERDVYARTLRELKEGIAKVIDEVTSSVPPPRGGGPMVGSSSSRSISRPVTSKGKNKRTISGSRSSPSRDAEPKDSATGDGDGDEVVDSEGMDNSSQTNVQAGATPEQGAKKDRRVRVNTAVSDLSISAKNLISNLATNTTRRRKVSVPPVAVATAPAALAISTSTTAPARSSKKSSDMSPPIFNYDPCINDTSTGKNLLRRGWFKDEADQLGIEEEVIEVVGRVRVQTETLKDYFPKARSSKGRSKTGGGGGGVGGGAGVGALDPRDYSAHVPGSVELPPLQCILESLQSKCTLILAEPQINAGGDVASCVQLVPSFALQGLTSL